MEALVIDPTDETRQGVTVALERRGWKVVAFKSSFAALEYLQSRNVSPTLVLDPQEADSRELFLAARRGNHAIAELPLVLFSAAENLASLAALYLTDLYMPKSTYFDSLVALVEGRPTESLILREDRMAPMMRHPCRCAVKDLMAHGCRCGGV